MEQLRVSFIIPAYNAASVLERSVNCARRQTLSALEIIVVDDGSKDDTAEIAKGLAAEDDRIVFVSLESNKGRLEARRAGIDLACGEFTLFLDADDEMPEDAAERLLNAQGGRFDIVQCDFEIRYQRYASAAERRFNEEFNRPPTTTAEGDDITHLVFRERKTTWSLCGKLMRTALLKEAMGHIPEGSISQAEDACIFFIVSCLAASYRGIGGFRGYVYNIDEGGSDARWKSMTREQFSFTCHYVDAMDCIKRFLEETGRAESLAEDYATVRHEHVRAVADKLVRCVEPSAARDAADELFGLWPADEAVAGMADACWTIPADCMELLGGAPSLMCSSRPVETVGIFQYRMDIGGAERVVAEQARLFASKGRKVVFFAEEPRENCQHELPEDLVWIELPPSEGMKPDGYRQRARIIAEAVRDHEVDVLVHNQWWNRLIAWDALLFKALDVPFCVFCHSVYMLMFHEADPREFDHSRILRHVDGLVVLSEADRLFWKKFNPRVWKTNNPATTKPDPANASDLSGSEVLWVGRLSEFDKQPQEAIEIFARVAPQVPDASLTLVGPAPNCGALEKLKRLARHLGVSERVSFAGAISDMEPFYQRASAYLLTSRLEGWCLTLAEAKAFGLPCVMYDLDYLTLTEGKRGIISVPQGDRDGAASALVELLEDKAKRDELGSDSLAHATELASFDFGAFWDTVLKELAGGSAAREGFEQDDKEWNLLLEGFKESVEKALDLPVPSYAKRKGIKTARTLWHRLRG